MIQETVNENAAGVLLSKVAILGFQSRIYHVDVSLRFPRCNQPCFIVMLIKTLLLNTHRPPLIW